MSAAGIERAHIGLGSNLPGEFGSPREQLHSAIEALGKIDGSCLLAHSGLYRSAPMGAVDQPAYVNAVALLETRLPAGDLLRRLQAIERAHGRRREREAVRWGPRTLDLDLLLYGDAEIQDGFLTLPHPRLGERNFVLAPLAEIDPDLRIPGRGALADLIGHCPDRLLERLSP